MDDRRYLETVENDASLPNGLYYGYWYKYDILIKAYDAVYEIHVTKYQRTQSVPVTLLVNRNLIDVYLGHIKE